MSVYSHALNAAMQYNSHAFFAHPYFPQNPKQPNQSQTIDSVSMALPIQHLSPFSIAGEKSLTSSSGNTSAKHNQNPEHYFFLVG